MSGHVIHISDYSQTQHYETDHSYFLNNLKMFDRGPRGPNFTWLNKRKGLVHIKKRLDSAMVNIEWKNMFPGAALTVLIYSGWL